MIEVQFIRRATYYAFSTITLPDFKFY